MGSPYDLHIHSCLSPCADIAMTPMNIAGMAYIKGLSIISLTDHNTGRNLVAMAMAAKKYGLKFVPGIEVTTAEEVHVLVYFQYLDHALTFCDIIYNSLPDLKNSKGIFGSQIIMKADNQFASLDKLLMQAAPYTLEQVVSLARDHHGYAVPAHINRDSFSLISNLGCIPDGLFSCVEISRSFADIDTDLIKLYSSNAHRLCDISEPTQTLNDVNRASDFFDWFHQI